MFPTGISGDTPDQEPKPRPGLRESRRLAFFTCQAMSATLLGRPASQARRCIRARHCDYFVASLAKYRRPEQSSVSPSICGGGRRLDRSTRAAAGVSFLCSSPPALELPSTPSTMSLPKTYKAAVIEEANAPFKIKDVRHLPHLDRSGSSTILARVADRASPTDRVQVARVGQGRRQGATCLPFLGCAGRRSCIISELTLFSCLGLGRRVWRVPLGTLFLSSLERIGWDGALIRSAGCHQDSMTVEQAFPTGLPRIPGHEIVGRVVEVPQDEKRWKVGDLVGSGAFCAPCFSGELGTDKTMSVSQAGTAGTAAFARAASAVTSSLASRRASTVSRATAVTPSMRRSAPRLCAPSRTTLSRRRLLRFCEPLQCRLGYAAGTEFLASL